MHMVVPAGGEGLVDLQPWVISVMDFFSPQVPHFLDPPYLAKSCLLYCNGLKFVTQLLGVR